MSGWEVIGEALQLADKYDAPRAHQALIMEVQTIVVIAMASNNNENNTTRYTGSVNRIEGGSLTLMAASPETKSTRTMRILTQALNLSQQHQHLAPEFHQLCIHFWNATQIPSLAELPNYPAAFLKKRRGVVWGLAAAHGWSQFTSMSLMYCLVVTMKVAISKVDVGYYGVVGNMKLVCFFCAFVFWISFVLFY